MTHIPTLQSDQGSFYKICRYKYTYVSNISIEKLNLVNMYIFKVVDWFDLGKL